MDQAQELERLMHTIEIKAAYKEASTLYTPDELARISQRLMAHGLNQGDYRFFNTALKINDALRLRLPQGAALQAIEAQEQEGLKQIKHSAGVKG